MPDALGTAIEMCGAMMKIYCCANARLAQLCSSIIALLSRRCLLGRGSKWSDPGLWSQYIFNIRIVSHINVGLKIASTSLVAFSLI